jgi:hypothetical protein
MRFTLALVAALLAGSACQAQRPPGARPAILQVRDSTVRVRLLNPAGRPLAGAPVEIWSDNGIRCIRAPCPTNGTSWHGRSDARGLVVIPTRVLQASTTLTTPGYEGDLVEGARPGSHGLWSIRLAAGGGSRD